MPVSIRVTKIHHACLTIDDGRTRLLLDPGQLGPRPGLDGVDAVLITHRHSDHFDPDLVEEALRRGIPVWAPGDALDELGGLDARGEDGLHEAVTGTTLRIGTLPVQVAGNRHAEVHPTLPGPANRAYLVDGRGRAPRRCAAGGRPSATASAMRVKIAVVSDTVMSDWGTMKIMNAVE